MRTVRVSGDDAGTVEGLDLPRLTAAFDGWFGLAGPLRARLLTGGKSNLTYAVTDGERRWVVRRPPLGHVLATAHDMSREYRVMSALRGTPVPVPETYRLCDDTGVIGAPFYVMAHVDGVALRTAAELAELGEARTRALSVALVETLAALHRVDPARVGLADFGRPDGFLARQVRRWRKQLDASRSRELAGADELAERLSAAEPPEQPPGIVHGDFRLDNLLVDGGVVRAVVDWEMATLGDPVTDLALMLMYGRLAELDGGDGVASATQAPGFLTPDEIVAAYVAAGGREPGDLGFYLGLAAFKLAVILEGIHYRFVHGMTVGEGFDHVGDAVEPLIATGLESLRTARRG